MIRRSDASIGVSRMVRTWCAAALLSASAFFAAGAYAAPGDASGDVLKVRLGGNEAQTRIVIDLDKTVAGNLVSRDDDYSTSVIALPDVKLHGAMSGNGQGLVTSWQVENIAGSVRLKLNFKTGAKIYRRFLLPPADGISSYRYVVDVVPSAADATTLATAAPLPVVMAPPPAPVETVSADDHSKKVIVIDAGHGGKDPGSSGAHTFEKDVNLAAAKALRDALLKTGRYKVIMTRDTDSFVDLPGRVRIARTANADLFISLHSDSAGGNSDVSGASIYTLSDSGTERAARKALVKGDWSLSDTGSSDQTVQRILIDLTQRATKNRSATFAQLVMDHIGESTPLLKSNLRQAGFVVLLAPDVPACLLEMGYITNPHDEAMLNDSHHREVMMGQVAKAIDQYFANDIRYASFAGLN